MRELMAVIPLEGGRVNLRAPRKVKHPLGRPDGSKTIALRWASVCCRCGGGIRAGVIAVWWPNGNMQAGIAPRSVAHQHCAAELTCSRPATEPMSMREPARGNFEPCPDCGYTSTACRCG
jgi:hypothetical protein